MSDTSSIDELYEALTIEKLYVRATLPPEFFKGRMYSTWYGLKHAVGDIAYVDKNNTLHRQFGPAYISRAYGYEIWYFEGKYHREGGPAIKLKTGEYWYKHGKLNNLNGPAIITKSGPKQYWIDGQKLSPKEYKKEIERRKRKGLL